MKLKCVVIDDEKPARSILKRYIEQIPFLELSGEFKGPVDALPLLEQGGIDLMFLDIRMPQMSGLSFIRSLKEKPAIVITTAYRDFALEGFELEVDDYLLKPIPMERFLRSVNKVREKLMARTLANPAATEEFLVLKSDKRLFRVRPEDILFIQSNREYATYHTKSFGKIMVHVSMKQLEEELSDHIFLRVHRSYIVNTGYVRQLKGNVLLIENHEIPVSSSYKEAILQLF